MSNDSLKRIPSKGEPKEIGNGCLLAEASVVARRVLESIQTLTGTTACKGVQIAKLKEWALQNSHWIADIDSLGVFSDRGSENEVYLAKDRKTVLKLNDFRYSDDSLNPFFDRIHAHNLYFPDCAYEMIGMAENREGKTCAVLRQPFILSEREATQEEIDNELIRLGFKKELDEYFTNGEHEVYDAVPNNVLMGKDGELYFIDTILFSVGAGGYDTYNSLSPRVSES